MKNLAVAGLMLVTGMALAAQQTATPPTPVVRMGAGYLKVDESPDSIKLLPPPPADGSKQLARDKIGEAKALKLQGTARWELAKLDADIFTPNAIDVMSCAAGRVLGPDTTSKTNMVLRKVMADLGMASRGAKNLYKRPRPFMGNGKSICTPDFEKILRADGSYPSGHATIGVGWGMILADLLPKNRTALLKRGDVFADSRRVCNVHFLSDVEAGGSLAKPVVEKLRGNAAYQADIAAAKAELETLPPVKSDCKREKAALAVK